jgi:peptidylprolyl isomerase
MAMHRLGTWTLAVLSVSGLGLAGCSSSSSTPSTTTPAATPTTVSSGPIASVPTADRSSVGTAGTAPTITVPAGAPPTQLESSDLIVGTGPEAKAGDTVTVQYVLATYSSGKEVQSSWTQAPFTFPLGEGHVIPGWDKGVVGMQAGGRRELIIPPDLGYGDQSPGPGISANDTLVFIVDMVKIN